MNEEEIINKIKAYEKLEKFDEDIFVDPPSKVLLPNKIDYLCKKPLNKFKRFIANFFADNYFKRKIRKGELIIDEIIGQEKLKDALKDGAIITCNHFSPSDNYIVFHSIRKYLPHKNLYKIIREGNYTSFPGLFGFFFRHCNTLPLSSNRKTMMKFLSATNTLLANKESILIYPEQALWPNYQKVRPFKEGAFKIAKKANKNILPIFISFIEDTKLNKDGSKRYRYTVHILDVINVNGYNSEELKDITYLAYKAKYEEIYKKEMYLNEEN